MKKQYWWLLIGYLIGSFFGVSALFGTIGGVAGRGQGAARGAGGR